MKPSIRRKLAHSKRRIQRRLDKKDLRGCSPPMMTASHIPYEIAGRTHGFASGGIGLLPSLARRLGLPEAVDQRLKLLKIHLPSHVADQVLALAYLPLCGGTRLQDLELLRQDEVLLDALGTRRLPDPTTAGDFCRRFSQDGIQTLLDVIRDARLKVRWTPLSRPKSGESGSGFAFGLFTRGSYPFWALRLSSLWTSAGVR